MFLLLVPGPRDVRLAPLPAFSPSLRSVALPPEHGGWGLLFEPIVIGLVAAPSLSGVLLGIAALGVFLARQPLKIVLTDRRAGRRVPRTRLASRFALGYLAVACAAGGTALVRADLSLLALLAAAAPLALVQIAFDARNRSRGLVPEVSGAAALAASAAAIPLADGWGLPQALALWAVAGARTIPAMVTVRTRVLRLHGEPASGTPPLIAHAAAMSIVFALQRGSLLPRGLLTVLSILAARAAVTLRPTAPRVRAQRIGIAELIIGLVASTLLGWLARGAIRVP